MDIKKMIARMILGCLLLMFLISLVAVTDTICIKTNICGATGGIVVLLVITSTLGAFLYGMDGIEWALKNA